MSWRALTEADLLAKMSSPELEAFRAAAIADGQADPIAAAIGQVTDLVRGYIASNTKNTLDVATDTLPVRLIPAAVDILVVDIPARAGGVQIDPEDARAKAKAQAIRLLEQVAADRFSIADPVSGQESSSGGATVVNARPPRFNRDNLRGF
jgi:hypothetical protein